MQETQTDSQEKETDFESFRDVQKEYKEEVQHGRKGTARLLDCEMVKGKDLPEEYKSERNWLRSEYLLFDAELSNTDKDAKVVCPAQDGGIDIETALDWAGASEIGELAGRRVPIKHIKGDVYRVENFNHRGSGILSSLPVRHLKTMSENNLMEFRSGEWRIPSSVSLTVLSLLTLISTIPVLVASIIPSAIISTLLMMIYPIGAYALYKLNRKT